MVVGFLDFLFPKYCVNCRKVGDYICSNCFSFLSFDVSMICLVCNKGSIDGLTHPGCRGKYTIDGAFAGVAYKGIVKKLIYNFKYKPYLSDLQKSLVELFYESIIQQEIFQKTLGFSPILVPIPLSADRLRKRGYNHAKLLAEGLSKSLNFKLIDALQRTRETKSQFGLTLKERKENIQNAFALIPNAPIAQFPKILLVDDILTTGSTLLEAARILKKNGAKKVWGLTLARD
ncbi:MAG: Phosphoribosyltransferase [Candidatus Levybacteria bacterium]|nr:Phosphoribosyltransferase [Candidatus Levybacteria bacterium]